jgi:hypothetical protein
VKTDIFSALAIAVFWIDTHKQSICNSPATQEG